MKVMLIIPVFQYKYQYPAWLSCADFPAGFAYLAASLKEAGHQVIGVNPNNDPGHADAKALLVASILEGLKHAPSLIGLGGLCTDYACLRDSMQIIRTHAPHIPVILGGRIVTHDREFIFTKLKPDYCLSGDAELTLSALATAIENHTDCAAIPNLGYWKDQVAVYTTTAPVSHDLDRLPFPDYTPFDITKLLSMSFSARYLYRYPQRDVRAMTIVTARGCPFSCTFCLEKSGEKYRERSIDDIMSEIEKSYEQYRFNVLVILDELFAVKKSRMYEFCDALEAFQNSHKCSFSWIFQTHANARLDEATLCRAKETGCYCFSYGLESASPTVLKSMNKKIAPKQISDAIAIARRIGLGFAGNFIYGDVAETQATVAESLNFFSAHCLDMHVYHSVIQPYPGSKLFRHCIEAGIISDRDGYYEHIDEKAWNMTSMPDSLWIPWLYLLYYLGDKLNWVDTMNVDSLEWESDNSSLPDGHRKATVAATCPHCGLRMVLTEVFSSNASSIRSVFASRMLLLKTKLAISNLFRFVGRIGNPMFVSTVATLHRPRSRASARITGCPHCNRRVKLSTQEEGMGARAMQRLIDFMFRLFWH